jgi:hypothetical protein
MSKVWLGTRLASRQTSTPRDPPPIYDSDRSRAPSGIRNYRTSLWAGILLRSRLPMRDGHCHASYFTNVSPCGTAYLKTYA